MIQKLFKSSILTIGNQLVVAVIGLLLTPFLVRGLGDAQYGLFALLILLLGVSGLLDLGLSKGIVKFIATYNKEQNNSELSKVFWLSVYIQLFVGMLLCITFLLFSSPINRMIMGNGAQVISTPVVIWLIAVTLPVVLLSGTLRGVLEGLMAFNTVNSIKFITNASTFIVPFLLISAGYKSMVLITGCLILIRLLTLLLYAYACIKKLPFLIKPFRLERSMLQHEIISFSGWVAVTNFIVPIVGQIDKFIITHFLGIAFVTYYTLPNDLINGLWIIPSSILVVMFPALSEVVAESSKLTQYYQFAVKTLLFCMCGICLVFFVYSFPIMSIWQNESIAEHSYAVLRIITIAIPITAASWIASNTLLAVGRSKYLAYNLAGQLVIYLPLTYLLTRYYGLPGAAAAVAIRMGIEAGLYFFWSRRFIDGGTAFFLRNLVLPIGIYLVLLCFGYLVSGLSTWAAAAWTTLMLMLMALGYYFFVFTQSEIASIKMLMQKLRA